MTNLDTKRTVALAQLAGTEVNIIENLKKIVKIVKANADSDIIIFPELTVHGHIFSSSPQKELVELIQKTPKIDEIIELAKTENVRIIFGSMEETEGKIYNIAYYIGRNNKIFKYMKTHIHWSETFDAGNELPVFDTSFDKIGMLICYDAAFPEASRTLALKGARVIIVIAAVPVDFPKEIMARRMVSIAVFNQVFVLYVNHGGPHFNGNSLIVNPKGEITHQLGSKEDILKAEIDLAEVDEWRRLEPVFPGRKADIYWK
jgi:predicted amidohydrolase